MDVSFVLARPVRVYEQYALPVLALDPKGEVRIGAAAVEETHAFATSKVAQQERLSAIGQRIRSGRPVILQVSDEASNAPSATERLKAATG